MECQKKRKVLVLEDLDSPREALVRMVEECGPHLSVHGFADSSSAFQYAMENQIDLFLVDIVLKPHEPNDFSGILFAKSIREHTRYAPAEIVFITTLAGLEAELLRSVHCFDYIEKPITKRRVQKVVQEAMDKLDGLPREDEMVFLRKDRVTYPVPAGEIVYVESRRKMLYVYTEHETIDVPNLSLKKFLDKIRTQNFLSPMRGIAVNLRHIEYVDPGNRFVKMRGYGEMISIGRRAKDQFMSEMFQYGDADEKSHIRS